jgi:hypothetical protein
MTAPSAQTSKRRQMVARRCEDHQRSVEDDNRAKHPVQHRPNSPSCNTVHPRRSIIHSHPMPHPTHPAYPSCSPAHTRASCVNAGQDLRGRLHHPFHFTMLYSSSCTQDPDSRRLQIYPDDVLLQMRVLQVTWTMLSTTFLRIRL